MITYTIEITERAEGVHFDVKTPSGKATPNEVEFALQFQKHITNFRPASAAAYVQKDWNNTEANTAALRAFKKGVKEN